MLEAIDDNILRFCDHFPLAFLDVQSLKIASAPWYVEKLYIAYRDDLVHPFQFQCRYV